MAHSCVARCQTLSTADLHDPHISTLRSRESFTMSTCLDHMNVSFVVEAQVEIALLFHYLEMTAQFAEIGTLLLQWCF